MAGDALLVLAALHLPPLCELLGSRALTVAELGASGSRLAAGGPSELTP